MSILVIYLNGKKKIFKYNKNEVNIKTVKEIIGEPECRLISCFIINPLNNNKLIHYSKVRNDDEYVPLPNKFIVLKSKKYSQSVKVNNYEVNNEENIELLNINSKYVLDMLIKDNKINTLLIAEKQQEYNKLLEYVKNNLYNIKHEYKLISEKDLQQIQYMINNLKFDSTLVINTYYNNDKNAELTANILFDNL